MEGIRDCRLTVTTVLIQVLLIQTAVIVTHYRMLVLMVEAIHIVLMPALEAQEVDRHLI